MSNGRAFRKGALVRQPFVGEELPGLLGAELDAAQFGGMRKHTIAVGGEIRRGRPDGRPATERLDSSLLRHEKKTPLRSLPI